MFIHLYVCTRGVYIDALLSLTCVCTHGCFLAECLERLGIHIRTDEDLLKNGSTPTVEVMEWQRPRGCLLNA